MVDFESFPAGDLEPTGVETKLSEDGCVDVSDVVSIFRGMKAKLIGGSVDDTTLDSATCHPNAESKDVMVPSISAPIAHQSGS